MSILAFPDIEEADENGLLAIGGDLEVDSLFLAYRSGIFPWPLEERFLAWFAPDPRAVLFLNRLHIPKRLERIQKKAEFKTSVDKDFAAVIEGCAKVRNRKGQRGTWITKGMIAAYCKFHQAGFAHSVECWRENKLVGGIYGVSIGGMFAAESMFYLESNASKLALLALIDHLRKQGVAWIDCQVLNPTTESLGATEVPRAEYMKLLAAALARDPLSW